MQQVWSAWKNIFGIGKLKIFFISLCLWIIVMLIYKGIKKKFNPKKVFLIITLCVAGFIFAWRQPYMPEKAHVLEYGVLAWLTMRDLYIGKTGRLKKILYSFIFVSAIGCLDEGFQKIIPWRYFETRDILTNIISGILGIALFLVK